MKIEDKICVRKPYYALQNLQVNNGFASAEVFIENLNSPESTLISISESGRHLAILGSCALAGVNEMDEMFYYLANKAYVLSNPSISILKEERQATKLFLEAKVESLDLKRKKGSVKTKIKDANGIELFTADVDYIVMKKLLFQKINSESYTETINTEINPYVKNTPLKSIELNDQICTAVIGEVLAEQCVGHFTNYPALPVAILSESIFELAGIHLREILKDNKVKYKANIGDLFADSLAFVGDFVSLKSTFVSQEDNLFSFSVRAINKKGIEFSGVDISLEHLTDLNDIKILKEEFDFQTV